MKQIVRAGGDAMHSGRGCARLHRAGVRLLVGSGAGRRYSCFDDLWAEPEELVVCGGVTGRADEFGYPPPPP